MEDLLEGEFLVDLLVKICTVICEKYGICKKNLNELNSFLYEVNEMLIFETI